MSSAARQFFRSVDILTGVSRGEGGMELVYIWLNILQQTNVDNLTVTVSDFRDINLNVHQTAQQYFLGPTERSDTI